MIIYKKFSPPYTVFIHEIDGGTFPTLHHAKDGQIHHTQWSEAEKDLCFSALCESQEPKNRDAWNKAHNL